MANRLSDAELRESLKEYGEDVGPITPTTRSAWERRLTALCKVKGFTFRKSSLNAFSSDDSEIESNSSNAHRRKRTSLNRHDSSTERISASPPDDETFKRPLSSPSFTTQGRKMILERPTHYKSVVGRGKKNVERSATTFDVETSDSDFDTDSSFSLSKTSRRSRRKHNRPTDVPEVSPLRHSEKPSVSYENSLPPKAFNSTWNSSPETSFQHYSSSPNRLKRTEHTNEGYHANGYLSNGELTEDRVEQGSSTNYSHCISWLLVLGTVSFFIIVGVVYLTELQKTAQVASKSYSKFCDGIEEEHCASFILVSRELHHLLTTVAGIYDCGADFDRKNRNMTLREAKTAIELVFSADHTFKMDHFDYIFKQSVVLLRKNPDMGIRYYSVGTEGEEKVSTDIVDPSSPRNLDFSALEAVQGSKSFWCRIRLSLEWTVAKILLLLFVGVIVFLCFVVAKLWKKRKAAQEKMFYEMVEKVIDILQGSVYFSTESFKAVVRVRDAIIPPKERKEKLWLWDRVVAFIEENESRVSVEYQTINGEDYKVWRWQPCTTPENEGGKQGKVWQGQAFGSLGKGKNASCSLTPCLKIRNMFDSEVEYEDGWQVSIQDAILEKCEGNDGIRHFAIDTSTNEGCVYMLCSSTESAGKAFNDLHGWWFDGKLVTVKYIPYKRYLERFPESEQCSQPLRPSNNKRLSLSTPFFSSALERS